MVTASGLQGCRKNDTFSPGAWRGDECARQVPARVGSYQSHTVQYHDTLPTKALSGMIRLSL